MKEQKFKVVKCLEHIPKWAWGNILEDDKTCTWYNDLVTCQLKPSDTFPLPEQGDKVEVSIDGINWSDDSAIWYYGACLTMLKEKFIAYDDNMDLPIYFKYIRPIEEKEECNSYNLLENELL